ncbi:MAG: CmcI family methyltransferase [Syntrophobacteraceae bacterium]
MQLLFDLFSASNIFEGVSKALLISEPDVAQAHTEQVSKRLSQLGIDFDKAGRDYPFDLSGTRDASLDNLIILKNDNELQTASLRLVERIEPEKLFLISIFANVFEIKLIPYKQMVEAERSYSFPFSLYTSIEDRVALHSLAKNSSAPGVVLEIGTRFGGSLVPIILGNRENGSPANVFSVDCYYHEYLDAYLKESGVSSEVQTFEMPSYRLARVWPEATRNRGGPGIRLLWIDGDHTYIGVKTDLVCFLPYLSDGGTVALHDYDATMPGIMKAVWEEIYNHPDFCDFQIQSGVFSAKKRVRSQSRAVAAKAPLKALAKAPNTPTDVLFWLIDNIEYKNKRILVCGGGRHSKELLTFSASFFRHFFESVAGVIDDNPQCACSEIENLPIHEFSRIAQLDFDRIIVSSYDYESGLIEKLLAAGVDEPKVTALYTNGAFVRYVTELPELTSIFQYEFSLSEISRFKG